MWLASPAGVAQPLRTGTLEASPLGYFGCYRGVSVQHYSCLAALREAEGVRIVFLGETGGQAAPFVSEKYVEDVLASAGALRVLDGPSGLALELVADLPRTGHVELRSSATRFAARTGNEGCLSYSVFYELSTDDGRRSIGVDVADAGTIGGVQVTDRRCNAYFTSPTSGRWWMTVLLEEDSLPMP